MSKLKITQTKLKPDTHFLIQHLTCPSKIKKYQKSMEEGDTFPPVRVVQYEESFLIIDGHHRIAAARLAGIAIDAKVADGNEFENLDISLSGMGKRADDEQFWRS